MTRHRNLSGRVSILPRRGNQDSDDRARGFGTLDGDGLQPLAPAHAATPGAGPRELAVMTAGAVKAALARAQASLDQARTELDAAMLSLASIDGDTVMANAELVALLLRVVTARRSLEDLAGPASPSPQPARN